MPHRMGEPAAIREEELKNRVAALFFGKYDCTRIVGNIDFCVSPKRRDSRQMTLIPDTPILWAEAKNHPTDIYRMLAQLILTIGRAGRPRPDAAVAGRPPYHADEPPKFAGCFDNEKIAFVEYHHILPVFNLNDFNWTQTPSAVDDKTVETVRRTIPAEKIVVFRFGTDDAEIKAFIARNFTSCESPALATPIDRNNFTFIYQKWRSEVMPHIDAPWDVLKKKYALYDRDFFLAEMNVDDNGTPELSDDRPAEDFYITFDANAREPYTIRRKNEDELNFNLTFGFKPGGLDAYAAFWRRYKRPPKREYWDFIVSRLDLLVPQDVRERKGAFFTPQMWVQLSQHYFALVLGENWQDEYDIWDCCGGTANLEVGLTNKYRVWVSTIDQQDVDVIKERIRNGANLLESHVFRFDFLNDSFDKLPQGLKDIILNPARRRKLVMYFNPPYAEASNTHTISGTGTNRAGVSQTAVAQQYAGALGRAVNELFAQFLIRIAKEIPGCVVGQFSKLKHLQGPNFKAFRQAFRGSLEKCFIVPADTFDNVRGKFPIGFFVWRLEDGFKHRGTEAQSAGGSQFTATEKADANCVPPESPLRLCASVLKNQNGIFTSTVADVYDREGNSIGTKTIYSPDNDRFIIDWLRQYYDRKGEHLAYLRYLGTDFQHNNGVCVTTRPSKADLEQVKGTWVTQANILSCCIYFAVRLCIEADWLNDRDQFLHPNDGWKEDAEFQADCIVFTLFSGQNRVMSRDGVNHWIPFTEEEVGAKDCFASHFMSDFINGRAGRSRPDAAVAGRPPYQADLFAATGESSAGGSRSSATAAETAAPHAGATSCAPPASVPLCLCVKETLSPAARAVLDAGRELWRYYHAQPGANPNASYYDIRAHFQGCKPNGTMNATSTDATYSALLANLRSAHKALAAQIEPKVYEYGFLKR